ncbi:MAG: hypothetical protein FK731_03720 [Asgard group archaeon]|nr:hypothetical protein [Asgard group archaeon]
MSPKKRKISCKFCNEKADYLKMYNDYFCSKCLRFQNESSVSDVKLLPFFKLKKYNIIAQKYSYIINNELGSRIGTIERRDISKFVSKKDYNLRYIYFNDINRIIASVDGKSLNTLKNADASWKVFDHGRNYLGEIKHLFETDFWQIVNTEGEIIAIRNPMDSGVDLQTARTFTIVNPEKNDVKYFQILRKGGSFQIHLLDETFDPHFALAIVIGIHRRYYI